MLAARAGLVVVPVDTALKDMAQAITYGRAGLKRQELACRDSPVQIVCDCWGKSGMSRNAFRKTLSHDHGYLKYMSPQRCGWDLTLASLAYMARLDVERRLPDLNAWVARHAAPPSQRYADLGSHAWVLWHGTTLARAEKIREHGLFHKGGLWTTSEPRVAHGYCRGRSEQFEDAGAMVCILLDRRQFQEGRNFQTL